ncbi:MAG: hypothetical protein HZC10_02765 [Nitrospirae bacterium]|nr:hypothetical protein [Nitrospirota bacterium]
MLAYTEKVGLNSTMPSICFPAERNSLKAPKPLGFQREKIAVRIQMAKRILKLPPDFFLKRKRIHSPIR